MDKHLLAENPMRSPEGGLCIIRTIQPVSIYQVHEGDLQFHFKLHKLYFYVNSDGDREEYTFTCEHFFSTDIDTADSMIVYKFMDDAWYWFLGYLKYGS